MAELDADTLRAAAQHRGLRLVRSRRRKPGGDFGRFGLTDAAGKELIGFGADGLTATADQIAGYLRQGEAATWERSARIAPLAAPPAKPRTGAEPELERGDPSPPPPTDERPRRRRRRPADEAPLPAEARPAKPAPPPPELRVRAAERKDATAIVALLRAIGAAVTPAEVETRIAASARAGQKVLVADRGRVIGCIAWVAMATLQHGAVARITLIAVDEDHRRRGTGRALVDAVTAELPARGCAAIEAMSDIEIVNAHGFFRALGFAQTSYRFARPLD